MCASAVAVRPCTVPMLAHPFGQIARHRNPMTGMTDVVIACCAPGTTPAAVLAHYRLTWDCPVVLVVNGHPVLRRWWHAPVPEGASLAFLGMPRGGGDSNGLQILASIAVIAAAALAPYAFGLAAGTLGSSLLSAGIMAGGSLLVSLIPTARKSSSTPTLDFDNDRLPSLSAGGNRARLGEPWPERFGRTRYYPDLLQSGYVRIDGATMDQVFYGLYAIGLGWHEVHGVFIDGTPLTDYSGATYRFLQNSETPQYIPYIVYTSEEISGQELQSDEWIVATVNPPGTKIYTIEFDLTFPAGLYQILSGMTWFAAANVDVYIRMIDDYGNPLTEWTLGWAYGYQLAYPEALRYSYGINCIWGAGRYEFMIRRGIEEQFQTSAVDDVIISGLRGFGAPHAPYPDATLLEVRIPATDKLSGNVADKIYVESTRVLPEVTATGFGAWKATRSIVDAIAWMVTTSNGGRLDASALDWELLREVRDAQELARHYFDYGFTSRTTVMDAVAQAAECGLAVPVMPGGKFALALNKWHSTPTVPPMGPDNCDAGSLKISYTPRSAASSTCVKVTYINGQTWQEEEVICMDANGSEDVPATITLHGCTSRQQAYEIGMRKYYEDRYHRHPVEMVVGMEGYIPTFGDRLQIAADMADMGQTGLLAAVDGDSIWLSEPVDWMGATSGTLYVTHADGSFAGYPVTPSDRAHCVRGSLPADIPTQQYDHVLATRYVFVVTGHDMLDVRVLGVLPQGPNTVRIVGNLTSPAAYPAIGQAPPLGGNLGSVPALIAIDLQYKGYSGGMYQFTLSWSGSAGMWDVDIYVAGVRYVLWQGLTALTLSFTVPGLPLEVWVIPRVGGIPDPARRLIATYDAIPVPQGLHAAERTATRLRVAWDAAPGISAYQVGLYVDGELVVGVQTAATEYTLTAAEWTALGGPWWTSEIKVSCVRGNKVGAAASLTLTTDALAAPEGLALVGLLENGMVLTWQDVPFATGYLAYLVDGPDGIPADGQRIYEGAMATAILSGLDTNPPYDYWIKVAGTSALFNDPTTLTYATLHLWDIDNATTLVTVDGDVLVTTRGDTLVYLEG